MWYHIREDKRSAAGVAETQASASLAVNFPSIDPQQHLQSKELHQDKPAWPACYTCGPSCARFLPRRTQEPHGDVQMTDSWLGDMKVAEVFSRRQMRNLKIDYNYKNLTLLFPPDCFEWWLDGSRWNSWAVISALSSRSSQIGCHSSVLGNFKEKCRFIDINYVDKEPFSGASWLEWIS